MKMKIIREILDHQDMKEALSSSTKHYENNHLNSSITMTTSPNQVNRDEVDNSDYHSEGSCDNNAPVEVDQNNVPAPRVRSRDVCGPYGAEEDYHPRSGADSSLTSTSIQLPSSAKLGCFGISRPKPPAYPEYASHDARIRTFESWPKSMPQTKEQLADAGFYYTGKGDQTLCYHCGGGLKDWEQDDDPWEQHAKWFSKCSYLAMVKGQDYINDVTGRQIAPPSKEETMQMDLPSCFKKIHETIIEQKKNAVESSPGPSGNQSNPTDEERKSVIDNNQEMSRVNDARMCKICHDGELGVVFLPCGHMVACVKCAPGMITCAICRKPVTMTVRAFLS